MKAVALLALLVMAAAHPPAQAFAEPLEEVTASVSDYDGASATVTISWNHDGAAASHLAGCVSCSPHVSESTAGDGIELRGVTPFPNSQLAMLYVIAYDSGGEIVAAKQLIIGLGE